MLWACKELIHGAHNTVHGGNGQVAAPGVVFAGRQPVSLGLTLAGGCDSAQAGTVGLQHVGQAAGASGDSVVEIELVVGAAHRRS